MSGCHGDVVGVAPTAAEAAAGETSPFSSGHRLTTTNHKPPPVAIQKPKDL